MPDEKQCFVIAPIGEAESETRKRSDLVLKHVVKPAVGACGYTATRADEISEPGMITSQVIQRIVDDPLVVADLTEHNPNVFYELALRHALRKPLVQIIRKGDKIPFDVAGMRTVEVDHRDLDSVEEAKERIVEQIRTLELDPSKMETPVSVSLGLQQLRQSDDPEQRSLAEVLDALTGIKNQLAHQSDQISILRSQVPREPAVGESAFWQRYFGGHGQSSEGLPPGSRMTPRQEIAFRRLVEQFGRKSEESEGAAQEVSEGEG